MAIGIGASTAGAAAVTGLGDLAPAVTVREERGLYSVEASFVVPHPPSIAHAVLTDYDRIPRFMPDVRTSTVVERSASHVLVQQEAVARMMMFSKRVHLLLEVHEAPGSIRFRDRAGKSFTHYEGAWRIRERPGGAEIVYRLHARPAFDVPEFLLKRLLRRDANEMIGRLRAEIAERSGHEAGPRPR